MFSLVSIIHYKLTVKLFKRIKGPGGDLMSNLEVLELN